MKISILVAVLVTVSSPVLAQAQSTPPAQPQTFPAQSGSQIPMGQMMQGQGMMGGMMQGRGMMGGPGRGMMGRFSPEDMSAFADAYIAALKAGLKLTTEQEKLWPPIEEAVHNLARLHLSHRQVMRQAKRMMASDPVGLLRSMADHMRQGAEAMSKLADAAAPLYATLDEAQKRRLQILARMGSRGMMGRGIMMGRGMMGLGGVMVPGDDHDDGDDL